MRQFLFCAGLMLLACSLAHAEQPPGFEKEPESCGQFGTTLQFADSVKDAAQQAIKAEKLVLVLHVSGHFEDARFT